MRAAGVQGVGVGGTLALLPGDAIAFLILLWHHVGVLFPCVPSDVTILGTVW